MTVADRIGVMDQGRLMQVAPPAEIYERPNSRWVADFIGSVNLFEGRAGETGGTIEGTIVGRLRAATTSEVEPGTTIWVAVRPEKMRLTRYVPGTDPAEAENAIVATVVDIGYLGDLSVYRLRAETGASLQAVIANHGPRATHDIGLNDKVWASFAPDAAIVLTR